MDFIFNCMQNGIFSKLVHWHWQKYFTFGSPFFENTRPNTINTDHFNGVTICLNPISATQALNNSLFVDASDNVLKFRDNSGSVRKISLI